MVDIKAVKKITVTEQIMEQIAQLIRSGQLQPGEQLPNERDLAEQFGVTRGRVREALRALSLIGLISIKAGEGSFVNKQEEPIRSDTIVWMFHNELNNLDEIYAARKLIETEVYISAAIHASSSQLASLSRQMDELIRVSPDFSPERFLAQLDEFDLHIGEICGNRIYAKLMQTIVHLRRETNLRLLEVPGAIDNSLQTRKNIIAALNTKQELVVRDAMQQFFASSKQFYKQIGDE